MSLSQTDLLLASVRSIAQTFCLGFGGFYLQKRGLLSDSLASSINKITVELSFPCLLFTSVVGCTQNWSTDPCPTMKATLQTGWPLIFLPFFNIGFGSLLGVLIGKFAPMPPSFRQSCIAAVALGNSTGMPVVLLSVIHMAFGPFTKLGSVNPVLFLSVYLLSYSTLQWVVGSLLLTPISNDQKRMLPDVNDSSFELEQPNSHPNDNADSSQHKQTIALQLAAGEREHRMHADDGRRESTESVDINIHGQEILAAATPAQNTSPFAGLPSWKALALAFLKPPIIASLVGIVIALTPVRSWFTDTNDRDNDAVLQPLFNAMEAIGATAIPLSMLTLGSSIALGAKWRIIPITTNVCIAFAKLVLMPMFGVVTLLIMRRLVTIDSDQSPSFFLVVLVVTATPTANNVVIMASLAGRDKDALVACLLLQYALCPVLLTFSLGFFVSLVESY